MYALIKDCRDQELCALAEIDSCHAPSTSLPWSLFFQSHMLQCPASSAIGQHMVSDCCDAALFAECKLDAWVANRAAPEGASKPAFSKAMAFRRLHWKNNLLGELLYYINISKVKKG